MLILPALDIEAGRLTRGPGGDAPQDPPTMARNLVAAGAPWLHLVDLDRALQAGRDNDAVLRSVILAARVPVQVGGRLRGVGPVHLALSLGAARAVVATGTTTAELAELADRFGPERLALGIDQSQTQPAQPAHLTQGSRLGIRTIVYRDLDRDGRMEGPDVDGAARLVGQDYDVILAGGVGSLKDVGRARDAGVTGLIVGRALLEGRFTLTEALSWAR
ncbi:MAG TPA: HisA/HisF-related TIM barrel protein [Gemmatimonadales bacterium]|nr:HisA/HisF-related TIM barrel protein [Gemmatimonadales bacterium]